MGADISTAATVVLLVLAVSATPITASTAEVADSNSTLSKQTQQDDRPTANRTVAVVITLQNHTARENVSFASNVTVTGGRDVEFMPVLFARAPAGMLAEIESKPAVTAVRLDRQIEAPDRSPAVGSDQDVRSTADGQAVPWGVRRMGAQRVSDRLRENRTEKVTVAVVDSGIDYTHPDLGDSVVWGVNVTGTEPEYGREAATDANGHGTAVAGIIAAQDNDRGVVGVAPGARLYSIKVLDRENTASISELIRGINAALEGPDGTVGTGDDADVIQISAGAAGDNEQLGAATVAASDSAVVVSSVGNDGDGDPSTDEVGFPAGYDETIGVAALGRDGETLPYSSEGDGVDVAAPGNEIETLRPGGGTTMFSGTSAATPHVSGMVAVLLAADRDSPGETRTTGELRDLVGRTARDIETPGTDRFSGRGLVRIDEAVTAMVSGTVERTASETTVAGGETVTITQTAYATDSTLTVADTFEPSVAAAEIRTVTVNGEQTNPAEQSADTDGTLVRLSDRKVGDRVEVTYVVELPTTDAGSERYRIANTDPSGGDLLRVRTRAPTSVNVSRYDRDDDGTIDAEELGIAGEDFTSGEISAAELGVVGEAFASDTIRS